MSVDCRVVFLTKDKPLELYVNQLKNLCEYRGSLDTDIITPLSLENPPEVKKTEGYEGEFYNEKSFRDAWNIITPELEKIRGEYYHLIELSKSIDFYKLSEEQQSNLMEDIEGKEEVIHGLENKQFACSYMSSLLDQLYTLNDYKDVIAYIEFI